MTTPHPAPPRRGAGRSTRRLRSPAPLLTLLLGLSACAADADGLAVELSALAVEGQTISRTNGCAACHGRNGEGGVGPELIGLHGREVVLDDGTTLLADETYLREAIVDPTATQVEGYRLPMPSTRLSDDQVDALIAYIVELADVEVGS